jgi:hypothetical protein
MNPSKLNKTGEPQTKGFVGRVPPHGEAEKQSEYAIEKSNLAAASKAPSAGSGDPAYSETVKPTSHVGPVPSPGELPPGWIMTKIGEVALVNPRWMDIPPDDDELVSFVPMKAVQAETGRLDLLEFRLWEEVKKGYTPFREGDVLFAKITPCMENGKFAWAVGLKGGRGAGSTEFHVLRPTAAVNSKLLLFFVFQDSFRRAARSSRSF